MVYKSAFEKIKMIFIVSRDWRIRSYLKAELLEKGFRSLALEDLNDIDHFSNYWRPDVIFLDSVGYRTEELREFLKRYQSVVQFILTEKALQGEYPEFKYLQRPFTIENCVDVILRCVGQRS